MQAQIIHGNLGIALGTEMQARQHAQSLDSSVRLFLPATLVPAADHRQGLFRPLHLTAIEAFCEALDDAMETENQDELVIVYTGSDNTLALLQTCLQVGAYLILRRELELDAVLLAFQAAQIDFAALEADGGNDLHAVSVRDCLGALDHALRLGWLVGPSSDAEPLLDTEEFAHYAHAANGNVHMLAPGSLYLFATPEDIEGGRAWADTAAAEGGAAGWRFSSGFCADLLADLGASRVVCLDAAQAAGAAAFAARGLAVAGLRAGAAGGRPSLLGAFDGLLSAAGGGRGGAVAVHSGAGFEWPAWMGTVATAFLVRQHGFGAAAAGAWVHMLCPWMV